jgi:hypothetical protein
MGSGHEISTMASEKCVIPKRTLLERSTAISRKSVAPMFAVEFGSYRNFQLNRNLPLGAISDLLLQFFIGGKLFLEHPYTFGK